MPKLKVLFDAGPSTDLKKTGVGYYVSHLTESLQREHGDKLDLTGYYFNFLNRHGDKTPKDSALQFHKIWLVPGKLLSLCRRLSFQPFLELFMAKKSDAIIFTNYVALPQLRKRKTALVIYDLGFLDVPEFIQDKNLTYLKRFCVPSIRSADLIITISEFTKARIKHYFPDLKADIVVTPIPPAAITAHATALTHNLIALGVRKKKYILYLGTIEPRKNLETLVAAYMLLSPAIRKEYALVLAGGKGWKDEGILQAVAKAREKGADIIMTGYVSDEEKRALYTNATCFVLPSHYEGFGMPILEAMAHGTPVAVSDIAVHHEVASDAALYFDKDDDADISKKLEEILRDKDLRRSLTQKGSDRLKIFSWKENADKVYEALYLV